MAPDGGSRIEEGRVEARPAASGGYGLFCVRDLRKGSSVRSVNLIAEICDSRPLGAREQAHHCTQIDGRTFLVGSPDCYMNHSCDPNCWYDFSAGAASPVTRARRNIAAGEELTVDYLINNSGGDSWPCECGAARCRGLTGVSFFTLPPAFQRDYWPLLAPWFVQRYGTRLGEIANRLGIDA